MVVKTLRWIAFVVSAASAFPVDASILGGDFDERYADLLDNPYAIRVLRFVLDPRFVDSGGGGVTQDFKDESLWFEEQDSRVFPIVLEVFKREDFKEGLNRKTAVMSVFSRKEGDKSDVLAAMRSMLEEVRAFNSKARGIEVIAGLGLRFLAEEGSEADVALINSFSGDESLSIRNTAKRQGEALRDRLQFTGDAETDKSDSSTVTSRASSSDTRNKPDITGNSFLIALVLSISLVAVTWLLKLRS